MNKSKSVINVDHLKKDALTSLSLTTVFGVVTVVLGAISGSHRGLFLCLTLGLIVIGFSVIELLRSYRGTSIRKIGIPFIQGLWISTSMSLGYVVTALAPYFEIPFTIGILLFVIGWFMLLYGIYKLVMVSKKTGLPLAV